MILPILACNAPGFGTAENDNNTNPIIIPPTIGANDAAATVTLPPPLVATTEGQDNGTDSNGATPTTPQLVALQDMNIRGGPSTAYDIVGFLAEDVSAAIIGQSPDLTWWKITCPAGVTTSDCWISGGAQYTAASNSAGVAVAAVPPTPTPAPTPTAAPTEPPTAPTTLDTYAAYLFSNNIWLMPLRAEPSGLTVTGEPRAITTSGDIERIQVAPNGRTIAFTQRQEDGSIMSVIDIDGTNQKQVARTSDMPPLPESLGDNLYRDFGRIRWANDSSKLYFNTFLYSDIGPGLGASEDLWQVSLEGQVQELFPTGSGGGSFEIKGNQVIMTTPTGDYPRQYRWHRPRGDRELRSHHYL